MASLPGYGLYRGPNGIVPVLGSIYNVRAYGATGNGTTDDTAAIDAAHAAIPAAGGTLYFPEGTYKRTSDLVAKAGVSYRGAGKRATILLASGCNGIVYDGTGIPASLTFHHIVEDMTIRGNYAAGKVGLRWRLGYRASWSRLVVEQFSSYGIDIEDGFWFTLTDSLVWLNDASNIRLGDNANIVALVNVESARSNDWGILVDATAVGGPVLNFSLHACTIEGNRSGGLKTNSIRGLDIGGCDFESNCTPWSGGGRSNPGAAAIGYHLFLGNADVPESTQGASIHGCEFFNAIDEATSGVGYSIWLDAVRGVDLAGNSFDNAATKDVAHRASISSFITDVVFHASNVSAYNPAFTRFGSSTFNGTTGRVLTHNLGQSGTRRYQVVVMPQAAHAGRIYQTKGTDTVTIKSTDAADTGAFDYQFIREA
jgi:hypothetical protein